MRLSLVVFSRWAIHSTTFDKNDVRACMPLIPGLSFVNVVVVVAVVVVAAM